MIGKRERFERVISELPGKWSVRERAAYGMGPNMCATQKRGRGKVEVWGGAHANEVWYVEDGREELVSKPWTPDMLAADVERALAMADDNQTRMEI